MRPAGRPADREATMSDPKRDVLRQIAELRRRMSPEVLERLRRATLPIAPAPRPAAEPYDKETAREAVKQFLASRRDGGRFRQTLVEALRRPNGKPH